MTWTTVLIVGVLMLAIMGDGDPVAGASELLDTIQKGKRLTRTSYGHDGVIRDDPALLAEQANTDLDSYALARMIASEHGREPYNYKAAVGHVAINYASSVGRSVSSLLLRANNPDHTGHFGTQRDIDESSANFNESDRYASTALDPYEGDLQVAVAVLSGQVPDFTFGAIQFDSPQAFKTPADAARTAAKRIAAGRTQVFPEGIDPDMLRFWA